MGDRDLVLGAGFGATGTHSLAMVLSKLGLRTWHFDMVYERGRWKGQYLPWTAALIKTLAVNATHGCQNILHNFDFTSLPTAAQAIVDTPVAELFVNLFMSFPRSRVILTKRPANQWVRSRLTSDISNYDSRSFLPVQEP